MLSLLKSELPTSSEEPLTLMILQVDLASLCLKAGVKNLSTVFLMTDAHVADERFLVLINDLLASGKDEFACEDLWQGRSCLKMERCCLRSGKSARKHQ